MDEARLRQLRDTAWTQKGWTVWKRGDPDKKAVWAEHVETGLDETLRALCEAFGKPEAIAIRRLHEDKRRT